MTTLGGGTPNVCRVPGHNPNCPGGAGNTANGCINGPLYGLVFFNGAMTFRQLDEIANNQLCPMYVNLSAGRNGGTDPLPKDDSGRQLINPGKAYRSDTERLARGPGASARPRPRLPRSTPLRPRSSGRRSPPTWSRSRRPSPSWRRLPVSPGLPRSNPGRAASGVLYQPDRQEAGHPGPNPDRDRLDRQGSGGEATRRHPAQPRPGPPGQDAFEPRSGSLPDWHVTPALMARRKHVGRRNPAPGPPSTATRASSHVAGSRRATWRVHGRVILAVVVGRFVQGFHSKISPERIFWRKSGSTPTYSCWVRDRLDDVSNPRQVWNIYQPVEPRAMPGEKSLQHKLDRVRPPRVQITYDVETNGRPGHRKNSRSSWEDVRPRRGQRRYATRSRTSE